MDDIGMDDDCFAPDPFLNSFVNDEVKDPVEDPLMTFVLRKDDPKLPTSPPGKSNQQVMDNIPMTTPLQTNPAGQIMRENTAASSKKRAREASGNSQVIAPELHSLLLPGCNGTEPAASGEAKKAKSTSENALEINVDVNQLLSNNLNHQRLDPRGINQKTDLEVHCSPLPSHSLLCARDLSQMSQNSVFLPTVEFSGSERPVVNPQGINTSPAGVNELGYKEEINSYRQPLMNPSSVASAVLSSNGGITNSPFSTSTFSDEDYLSVITPNSFQNVQENQTSFSCLPNSQVTNADNRSMTELVQFQGIGNSNDLLQEHHPFQDHEPLLYQDPNIIVHSSNASSSSQITSGSTQLAFCKVLNPKKEYDKNQKKLLGPRRSEQRIQGGKVKMKISTKIPLGDQAPLKVFVRREPSAAQKQCHEHPDQFTMEMTRICDVQIRSSEETPAPNHFFTYKCEFDLDSVYQTADGKEVYKLVKSKGAFNNRFQLSVCLRYNNGFEESLIPYEFVLKSGRTPTQQDHHRERHNAGMGNASDGPRAHLVSCRYLDAETAQIKNIHCENIETKNHDIAYFIKVKGHESDVPSDMEKGDVVVFLEDEEEDTYIDFLTSENARKARLAGVISRTAFFRGRTAICDPDHVDCDLVCIIGEVEVKIVGKVEAGDLIYTSNCEQYRGSAVARNPLEPELLDTENGDPTPTLLGMAMESNSDLDIKLVRCLVSIVLGISDLHQRRTLEELRNCHANIVKIQRYLKGIWKKSLILLILFLIVGIMCYLFLAPNSPYLIMKCEKGCIENKKGSCLYLKFEYFHDIAQESDEIVGIRFNWRTLKHKLELSFGRCPNKTGYHYYLNKNRCVTGGIRSISAWLDPSPLIPRVNVLAVSPNCSQVFYYSASDRRWEEYNEKKIKVNKCDH